MNRLKSEEGEVQTTLDREFRQFNLGKARIAQIVTKASVCRIPKRKRPASQLQEEKGAERIWAPAWERRSYSRLDSSGSKTQSV